MTTLTKKYPDFRVGDTVKYTAEFRQIARVEGINDLPATGAIVVVDPKPVNPNSNLKIVKVLWEGAEEPKSCLTSVLILADQADLTGL